MLVDLLILQLIFGCFGPIHNHPMELNQRNSTNLNK